MRVCVQVMGWVQAGPLMPLIALNERGKGDLVGRQGGPAHQALISCFQLERRQKPSIYVQIGLGSSRTLVGPSLPSGHGA